MTILRALEIACDGCTFSERLDSPTLRDEWPYLSKNGWTRGGGEHFCPFCSKATNDPEHRQSAAASGASGG